MFRRIVFGSWWVPGRHGGAAQAVSLAELIPSLIFCALMAAVSWGGWGYSRGLVDVSGLGEPAADRLEAVIVLAGAEDRWDFAERMVQQEHAPRILSTLVLPHCVSVGSDESACRTGVRNTVDEALVMRRVLESEHIRRAAVVTSDFHLLRAGAVFSLVFAGSGIRIDMVPASQESRARVAQLAREMGMLGPSMGGAVLGRFLPSLYESLMRMLYDGRTGSGSSQQCSIGESPSVRRAS